MSKRELIFQAFNYTLQGIKENLPKLSEQGFTVIQTSPLQQHKEADNSAWYLTYQITNFKIGNRLGSKDELIDLCKEAEKYNIKIIVDFVFNHVANAGRDNLELVPSPEVEDEIRLKPEFFHDPHRVSDYDNRYQCTQFCIGLPDLNTANHKLQNMMIDYLNELVNCGVKGFRLDAVRHVELPDDPLCGSDFWDNLMAGVKDKENLFIYGECIYSTSELIEKYSKYMLVGVNTPCTTKPSELVRWPFSHDDDLTFHVSKAKNKDEIIDKWEQILRYYPETHMVFYPPAYDNTWMDERMKQVNNIYK